MLIQIKKKKRKLKLLKLILVCWGVILNCVNKYDIITERAIDMELVYNQI